MFDTPSWCDGSLTIRPPNVPDVDDEVAVVVRCRVDCCTDGIEALTPDDVADR